LLYVVTSTGKVECRHRSDGSLVWTYQMGSFGWANMALHNGILYCTNDDRCVRAVDCNTGAELWKRCHTGNFARSAPYFAGDIIFTSGCTGDFYGDDAATGNNVWSYHNGADNSFNDWAYADGYLIGSNRDGTVFCFRGACPSCTVTISPTV